MSCNKIISTHIFDRYHVSLAIFKRYIKITIYQTVHCTSTFSYSTPKPAYIPRMLTVVDGVFGFVLKPEASVLPSVDHQNPFIPNKSNRFFGSNDR